MVKLRGLQWMGPVSYVRCKNAYKIVVGEHEGGKKKFWRPIYKSEDNIEMNLKGMGCYIVDWIHLVENRDQ
jgi:hypothetical protein